MSTGTLLGIDIGTTATKIIIIDLHGHLLADVSLPSELFSFHAGWAEEDANSGGECTQGIQWSCTKPL